MLATAWAADNIQVNAMLPGWIDTELTRGARRQVDGLHDRVLARTPAARWGEPATWPGWRCSWRQPGVGLRHRYRDPRGRRLLSALG